VFILGVVGLLCQY